MRGHLLGVEVSGTVFVTSFDGFTTWRPHARFADPITGNTDFGNYSKGSFCSTKERALALDHERKADLRTRVQCFGIKADET